MLNSLNEPKPILLKVPNKMSSLYKCAVVYIGDSVSSRELEDYFKDKVYGIDETTLENAPEYLDFDVLLQDSIAKIRVLKTSKIFYNKGNEAICYVLHSSGLCRK